jgi:hypothetical protein
MDTPASYQQQADDDQDRSKPNQSFPQFTHKESLSPLRRKRRSDLQLAIGNLQGKNPASYFAIYKLPIANQPQSLAVALW